MTPRGRSDRPRTAAPQHADAHAAYEQWHERLEVDAAADTPWHRLVRKHLPPLAGRRVLEIGCGRGGFAAWLARHGAGDLVAADFSRTAVRKAASFVRGEALRGVACEIADIQRLPHDSGAFDVVISCETIEHVTAPGTAVRELARVLRPGGRLFLTTPNYLGPMGLHRLYRLLTGRPYAEEGQPINHPLLLPRTRRWVRRAGLRIVTIDATGHYLPVPGRPPVELPALDRLGWLTRWFALHPLIVAAKPRS